MLKVVKKKPEAIICRIQPERKGKKTWDMVDPADRKDQRPRRFDMIGAFIKYYGGTGANVACKIIIIWIFQTTKKLVRGLVNLE